MRLTNSFYTRAKVTSIAKALLGKVLCTSVQGRVTSGIIVETEAYSFRERGCHAYRGLTKRNAVMFEAGGVAYVYLCYGVHEMVNVVTNKKGRAEAVLIRALYPVDGVDTMVIRSKSRTPDRIASGPGKLTKAMGIDRSMNGKSLLGNEIWIDDKNITVALSNIASGPRIGIDYAGEDAALPWRFTIRDISRIVPQRLLTMKRQCT